jgi:hypothetical protein
MANIKTTIDEWEVKDLEDNSTFSISVLHNTEMGNNAQPGIQVICAGKIVNYEPLQQSAGFMLQRKQIKQPIL